MRKFVFRPSGYQQYVNIGTQTVHSVRWSECLHVSASTRHNFRAHVTVTQRPQEPIPAGQCLVHHVEAVFMEQKAPSLFKAFRPQTYSVIHHNLSVSQVTLLQGRSCNTPVPAPPALQNSACLSAIWNDSSLHPFPMFRYSTGNKSFLWKQELSNYCPFHICLHPPKLLMSAAEKALKPPVSDKRKEDLAES